MIDRAIYARVSTDEQNPESQLTPVREYCKYRGWDWDQGVLKFVDHGISGTKESRPAWDQVWRLIQAKQIKVLIVPALDRIGRSLPHLVKIIYTLIQNDITLISVRENIDLSTPAGRLMAGIIACMAEYERSLIVERTKAGLVRTKAKGTPLGGKNPKCRNLTQAARLKGAHAGGEVMRKRAEARRALAGS